MEQALAIALRRGLTTRDQLAALLDRHPNSRSARRLRDLVESGGEPALSRSEAEERSLKLFRKGQLPAPQTNVMVCGFEVDFYWPAERFVVEIDGFAFHSSAEVFEQDRRRDAVLSAAGIRVMRVTWTQLTKEPEALLVRIGQALARS